MYSTIPIARFVFLAMDLSKITEEDVEEVAAAEKEEEEGAVGGVGVSANWADCPVTPEGSECEYEDDNICDRTIHPVRGNRGMTKRELDELEDEWVALRATLDKALELRDAYQLAEKDAFGQLSAFLKKYEEEGKHRAWWYQRDMTYQQKMRALGRDWLNKELKRAKEQKRIENLILDHRQKTHGQSKKLQQEAKDLQKKLNDLRMDDPVPKNRPIMAYRCPICGLHGVMRGNECPNVLQH